MKVILLQDIRSVGRKHDIKEVADGYAMNFLIARKLAEPATPEKAAALESARALQDAALKAQEEKLAEVIRSLNGKKIELTARATEKGGLFKSISVSEITRAIQEQNNVQIPESSVILDHPLKIAGEHEVELKNGKTHAKIILTISEQI